MRAAAVVVSHEQDTTASLVVCLVSRGVAEPRNAS